MEVRLALRGDLAPFLRAQGTAAAGAVTSVIRRKTNLLQRRLRVGYSRAARILDQLERANIVGPPDGTKPRDVLITSDDLESLEASSL